MSHEMADLIAEKFGLEGKSRGLLEKNIRSLGRAERRFYFERLKPMEGEIKKFLDQYCSASGGQAGEKVFRDTVSSLLERSGDPDLADSMAMDVLGRLRVYKALRERAESEGVKLSALTNFGGLSMVLFAVVIITAIVLYLKNM